MDTKIVIETLSNGDIHTCTYMQKNILEYNQKLQDYKKKANVISLFPHKMQTYFEI